MANQIVKYDNNDHIIRTKTQWDDAAIANFPIPRGVLCIEIVSLNEMKLKVGTGDKYYKQLPYIGGSGGDLSNYYTKAEVDTIIKNLSYMSIVSTTVYPSKDKLPTSGNSLGDLRFVVNPTDPSYDPVEYIWNGTRWVSLGGITNIDLSKYVTRDEIMPRVTNLEKASHTHGNKSILDKITAAYTQEEKVKLRDLKNYDDTQIQTDITSLKRDQHNHLNKLILDQTTAPYTREEKEKLASLEPYDDFHGTDGSVDGSSGLVPGPTASDTGKFLNADGTWKEIGGGGIQPATQNTLGGVKIGDGIDVTNDGTISMDMPTASSQTLGGVKVGNGLQIDANGVLSTEGGSSSLDYVAGDGISIDQGSMDTDITSIAWESGSINSSGIEDNTATYAIRSPFIDNCLTDRIGVSAITTSDQPMYWKIFYYDSSHTYYAQSPDWYTSPTTAVTPNPNKCKYIRIVLIINVSTPITTSTLGSCELSYPVEVGKYVITNTGVTHIELDGNSIVKTEDSETMTLITYGSDFKVTGNELSLADFNRLILNVEA